MQVKQRKIYLNDKFFFDILIICELNADLLRNILIIRHTYDDCTLSFVYAIFRMASCTLLPSSVRSFH